MRHQGRITTWKEDRGFGFITPSQGGKEVFVHVSSITNPRRLPLESKAVTYELATDEQGRAQAKAVTLVGEPVSVSPALWIPSLFLALVGGLAAAGRLPPAVPVWYLAASAVAFVAYAWDKGAARSGHWRTSEAKLHLIGLTGGWPGALIARHVFRHKTTKRSFIVPFWATVVLNCGALLWLLTPAGQRLLTSP